MLSYSLILLIIAATDLIFYLFIPQILLLTYYELKSEAY